MALLAWVVLFFLARSVWPHLIALVRSSRSFWYGVVAAYVLLNLIAVAFFDLTPYTYRLLPVQTIRIEPLSGERPVEIHAFSTQVNNRIGIRGFSHSEGWRYEGGRIVSDIGADQPLVWEGRPGEFVRIQFQACEQCGQVRLQNQAGTEQLIDLNRPAGLFTYEYTYPSLLFHRLANLILLQGGTLAGAMLLVFLSREFYRRLHSRLPGSDHSFRHLSDIFPILVLVSIAVVTYLINLRPVLFNDDWCQIVYSINFDRLELFMFYERRPLHLWLPWLFSRFLPLDATIYALHYSQVILIAITSGLIYKFMRQLPGIRGWFAFLIAALWLLYPSDYTRLYITMSGHRTVYLLLILAMIVFLLGVRLKVSWYGLLAGLIISVSLLIYEGQLGLGLILPLMIIAFFWHQRSKHWWVGLVGYYFPILVFVFWRLILQPQIYTDAKLESLSFNLVETSGRYFEALRTIIGGFQFPFRDFSWLTTGLVITFIGLLVILLVAFQVANRLRSKDEETLELYTAFQSNIRIFLMGLVLWAAGYFPIILNFPPNIYGHLSRVNIFSIPGAAMMLLALVDIIMLSISRNRKEAMTLTILAMMPVMLVAGMIQLQVKESYDRSWQEAKVFYQGLLEIVPDLKPDTQVVFLLDGYERTATTHRPVFSSYWEAWCALRVLYDQPELQVNYRYRSIYVPPFPAMNVLAGAMDKESMDTISDPSRLLVIIYDHSNGRISISPDGAGLFDDYLMANYNPQDRILPLSRQIPSRRLID